jgi:hypothetical protein
MTDENPTPAVKSVGMANLKPFKKGYDPRRWLNGRGKKSPEQREGEQILRAVIWEELSREFDTARMKPLDDAETVDALRLMVRTWIKKRPAEIAERIAGKVPQPVELTGKDGGAVAVQFVEIVRPRDDSTLPD